MDRKTGRLMDEINIENAKKFHLLLDTLQDKKQTYSEYYHLNRVWKFLKKEFRKNLIFPTKCIYETPNMILVWSTDKYYADLEISNNGFVSSFYKSRDEKIIFENNLGDSTLPSLTWIDYMKKYN